MISTNYDNWKAAAIGYGLRAALYFATAAVVAYLLVDIQSASEPVAVLFAGLIAVVMLGAGVGDVKLAHEIIRKKGQGVALTND